MFAISRKGAFLRASIIGVIIIAVISIASIFVINKNMVMLMPLLDISTLAAQ